MKKIFLALMFLVSSQIIFAQTDFTDTFKVNSTIKAITPVAIKDENFKKELDLIFREAKNGYINNRINPLKDLSFWKFDVNIKLDDFNMFQFLYPFDDSLKNRFFGFKVFLGENAKNEAEDYFLKIVSKLEGNLNYKMKKANTDYDEEIVSMDYILDTLTNDKIYIVKRVEEEDIKMICFFYDFKPKAPITIENPNSTFGVNETNYEKLKEEITEKLLGLYNESKTKNGLKKYEKPDLLAGIYDNKKAVYYCSHLVSVPYTNGVMYEALATKNGYRRLTLLLPEITAAMFFEVMDNLAVKLKSEGVVVKNNSIKKGDKTKSLYLNKKLVVKINNPNDDSPEIIFYQQ